MNFQILYIKCCISIKNYFEYVSIFITAYPMHSVPPLTGCSDKWENANAFCIFMIPIMFFFARNNHSSRVLLLQMAETDKKVLLNDL